MEDEIVTRNDCEKIIKTCIGSDKFEVVNFKIKPFEDPERDYYKPNSVLEISVKISKSISRFRFFLKKFHSKYLAKNELHECTRASEREILFYEYFLPKFQMFTDVTPQYLYGELNRVIVLEDLSLKLFTFAKKSNPNLLDRFHVSLALKAVAKLHAASFAYKDDDSKLCSAQDLLSHDTIWRKGDGYLGKKVIQSGVKGLKSLLQQTTSSLLDASLNKKIDNLVQKSFDILSFQTSRRNVLGHGDLHTKNILFKYDRSSNVPTDCKLINFGNCRYFLPAYDVLTLIFNSTNRLFRQHYFTYLIKYYYDCLHNELLKQELHLNAFLTFEELQQSINFLMPAIKLKKVLHLQDFGAKPGFYNFFKKDEIVYKTYMCEDKSLFLLELYKKDPIFKDMITEALEELLETLHTPEVSRENCYEILEGQLQTTTYDLKEFKLLPLPGDEDDDNDKNFELILEVSGGQKDDSPQQFRYLVKCGDDNFFKVRNRIFE